MGRSCLFILAALVLGGCSATINDESNPPGPVAGVGGSVTPGSGGSAGQAPGTGGGQTAGTGGQAGGGQAGAAMGQGGAVMGGAAGTGAPAVPVLDSGHVVLRRLNQAEYNNTVRDLMGGTSLRPADRLPNDETADGFDTVGEALGLTLAHFEVLEQGATELVDELFALPVADDRRRAVLVCDTAMGSEECSRQVLGAFARRAFRRPVLEAELTGLIAFVQRAQAAGNSYDEALRAAMRSVLLSPHFLYMVERSAPGTGGAALPVNGHELATRLSYFLWSSMPDPALSAEADAGTLTGDAALQAAAARMLADSKASALIENFAGQWLTLRRLALVVPDPATFPDYDDSLLDAAVEETERFVSAILTGNAPLETFVTADFTFVNEALATHYGLSAGGPDFPRVSLADVPRVGVLGQTSYLAQTSHPSFTAPTKRGVWVLEQLLCSPPEPPPGDLMIEPLGEPPPGQSVRQHLERHRSDPKCAGCHAIMDPIGYGVENFDAIGAYRTIDNGVPVDASGTIEGVAFVGVRELANLLAADPRLPGCITKQLLTYAVGRPFEAADARAYADALVGQARAAGRRGFRDLIETVVGSEAFRTRRGE